MKRKDIKSAAAVFAAFALVCSYSGCTLKNAPTETLDEPAESAIESSEPSSSANTVESDVKSSAVTSSESTESYYITGASSVGVFSDKTASEEKTRLKAGTKVESEELESETSSTVNTYVYITSTVENVTGYVYSMNLTDEPSAVTSGVEVKVGASGAYLYDSPSENGAVLRELYEGTTVYVAAKISGGYWRVMTEDGVYGYVDVTRLDRDNMVQESEPVYVTESDPVQTETDNASHAGTENGTADSQTTQSTQQPRTQTGSDADLEKAVASARNNSGGNWAAALIDLTTGETSSVNSSAMQSASLIKLFIMGAVYENYDAYSSEPNLDSWLYQMITVSDNTAANNLVRVLGGGDTDAGRHAVTAYCQSHGYGSTSMGRLLLESNINGDNYTSVLDCARFLQAVYNNELPHSSEMLSTLKQQTITYKIPDGVPVPTANKTGELSDVQNDAAIVFADEPYVLVVMSENVAPGTATASIVELSAQVYSDWVS